MSEWDPFDDRPRRRRRKTVTRKKRRRTDPFGYEEERPRRRRSTTAKKTTKKRKRGILRDIADTARGVKILAKTVTARPRRKIKRVAKRAVGIFAYDPDNLKRRMKKKEYPFGQFCEDCADKKWCGCNPEKCPYKTQEE